MSTSGVSEEGREADTGEGADPNPPQLVNSSGVNKKIKNSIRLLIQTTPLFLPRLCQHYTSGSADRKLQTVSFICRFVRLLQTGLKHPTF
jgi:hypothetical protein